MTTCFSRSVRIDRSPERVWRTLTNWSQAPRWMSSVDHVEPGGELAPGTELTFQARGRTNVSKITELLPNRRLALRSQQGGMTAEYEYSLAADGLDGTLVTLRASCGARGLLCVTLSPIIRLAIRLTDRNQLTRLRQLVEGEDDV